MPEMEKFGGDLSRRKFLKNLGLLTAGAVLAPGELLAKAESAPQTHFDPTQERLANGELVYALKNENNERLGEFWPIHGIKLVTKQTDPDLFEDKIQDMHQKLRAVATTPDGMTRDVMGSYVLQGKSLAQGKECGDGIMYDYGIIVVENETNITFTHAREHQNDFDSLYQKIKNENGTLFFLPSVLRNDKYLSSSNVLDVLDKVLIRRDVPDGTQIGVMMFDKLVTYDTARELIQGLDRAGKSTTTHIYVLDGGGVWGQSTKQVNGSTVVTGTRDPKVVTNYLIFD